MKTIGIKLADGSFYPILKEGTAEKKELNLTTVKDNQTTVQVDLYRSESGTMEDAEYVDTLEIKHLKKHPNGDPDIALDISLDENNELKAELHDPETGRDSSTTVDLVSRTLEQRNETSDITGADITEDDLSIGDLNTDDLTIPDDSAASDTGDLNMDDLSIPDDNVPAGEDDFDLESSLSNSVKEESFDSDEEINFDPNSLSFDSIVEEPAQDTTEENTESTEDDINGAAVAAGAAGAGLLGAAAALSSDDSSSDETIAADESFEMPEVGDFSSDDAAVESNSSSETTFTDDDFNIPEEEEISFDVPSTDDTAESTAFDSTSTDETAAGAGDDLFADDPFGEKTATAETSSTSSAGLDFSDILDEETKEGHAAESSDTETIRKKTKVPVLICIICAIICIIAVILVLFVIPSKANLVKKSADAAQKTEVVETSDEKQEEEVKHPAKENEIVVAPAEEVVPEKPKAKKAAGKNITYKIKWGDTLWDLAKSYYNNPWKYHKIAKYNGIKNPDHIISGTTIIIPAE